MAAIGVAVVGAGYWGPNLVRTFRDLAGCELRYICDQRPGRLDAMRNTFPGTALTSDYSVVLDDPSVHAVVLATPVGTHRALGERALRASKHLLVEKPLAATAEDARALRDVAREEGMILAVGHIFVYHSAVVRLRELIAAGALGELCYAASSRVNLGPPASEVDVIWDLAVHDVSILSSLVPAGPVEVMAECRRYIHPDLFDVAIITLRYANGFMANVHASWLSPVKVRTLFIAGTGGSATFDDTIETRKLAIADRGRDSRIDLKDGDSHELFYRPGEVSHPQLSDELPLTIECKRFLTCIAAGVPPEADGDAGVSVVEILEAASTSAREGVSISLSSTQKVI